jgi:hypothetical protein
MEDNNKQKRLAVLIDADNAQPSIIEAVLEEVANLGIASVKRIYGDWTSPNLKSWKELVLEYSIQPHQQFAQNPRCMPRCGLPRKSNRKSIVANDDN